MGFPRTLFLHHLVLISLVSLTIAQPNFLGHFCSNYTSTSAYKTNRDTLLSSLASNTDQYGFYTSAAGKNPDTVYALVLCRGDVKLDACRECISNSVANLTQLCPDKKEAIGWYDNCMLRYSNKSMKGIMSGDPTIFVWNDKKNVTSWEKYKDVLEKLLENLRDKAAAGGSLRKYASGNATGPDAQNVYALAQCTPDLSENDCSSCLKGAIDDIPQCCDERAGGRVIRPSCHFRYELTPFFAEIPGSLAPAEAPSPPTSSIPSPTGSTPSPLTGAAALGNLIMLALVLML
ncbi:hypothetical protein Vadar_005757 [Vaccinium darrowii]|uniref:Uncharacterized protein n=1 Tax=Vaccinium darrowii TaxID=229202 RepID=A0ACB7ZAN7_9ERIC|nr:hypothetical protein Vadar_005757 [Vaccinium darrowii]